MESLQLTGLAVQVLINVMLEKEIVTLITNAKEIYGVEITIVNQSEYLVAIGMIVQIAAKVCQFKTLIIYPLTSSIDNKPSKIFSIYSCLFINDYRSSESSM